MQEDILNNISQNQLDVSKRVMNLALIRIYKKLHQKATEQEKKQMEEIFESGSEQEKENFIKKYLPDFEEVYKKELSKIVEELS
jgi:hypothetical protein